MGVGHENQVYITDDVKIPAIRRFGEYVFRYSTNNPIYGAFSKGDATRKARQMRVMGAQVRVTPVNAPVFKGTRKVMNRGYVLYEKTGVRRV